MKKDNKPMDKKKLLKKDKKIRPKTQPHGKNVHFGKKLTSTTVIQVFYGIQ